MSSVDLGAENSSGEVILPVNGSSLSAGSYLLLNAMHVDVDANDFKAGEIIKFRRSTTVGDRPTIQFLNAGVVQGSNVFVDSNALLTFSDLEALEFYYDGVVFAPYPLKAANDNAVTTEQWFSQSGSFTIPANATRILFAATGAGGKGQYANEYSTSDYVGLGGGGGAFADGWLDCDGGEVIDFEVGAASSGTTTLKCDALGLDIALSGGRGESNRGPKYFGGKVIRSVGATRAEDAHQTSSPNVPETQSRFSVHYGRSCGNGGDGENKRNHNSPYPKAGQSGVVLFKWETA